MKKKKLPVKKKKSVAKLKALAWKLFSVYIRLRDSDFYGMVRCYSCGQRFHWKRVHAGHFIPGRHNSILFDERNVHGQCYVCNVRMHGNTLPYLDHMLKDYGLEVVNELRAKDHLIKQFDVKELELLIVAIKEKTKLLNK